MPTQCQYDASFRKLFSYPFELMVAGHAGGDAIRYISFICTLLSIAYLCFQPQNTDVFMTTKANRASEPFSLVFKPLQCHIEASQEIFGGRTPKKREGP